MKKWQIYVVVILFNFVSFYRSLDGEFVFDDSVAILKNNDVNKRNISIQVKVIFFILKLYKIHLFLFTEYFLPRFLGKFNSK